MVCLPQKQVCGNEAMYCGKGWNTLAFNRAGIFLFLCVGKTKFFSLIVNFWSQVALCITYLSVREICIYTTNFGVYM